MTYTDFGTWKISKMSLGTVQLGLDYGIANRKGKPSIDNSFKILEAAIDGGVNSFDTANAYGDSEEIIGKCFYQEGDKRVGQKDSIRNNPIITTKFKVDPSAISGKSSLEKQIFGSAQKSLERLKISKIPIFMLHDAGDMYRYGNTVTEVLKELRSEGLIEKAGVSVYNTSEVEEMLKSDIYEAIQMPMNVFDLRMDRSNILKKLGERGYIVFARSVFLQGLFFLDPYAIPKSLVPAAGYLVQLRELAEHMGLSVAQLVLSFIRDLDGITSLVLGSETLEQVLENIRLMDTPELSCEATAGIEKISHEVPIEAIMDAMLKKK